MTETLQARRLARLGIAPKGSAQIGGKYVPNYQVRCAKCPATAEHHAYPHTQNEALVRHFSSLGWLMSARPICPACQSKENKVPNLDVDNYLDNVSAVSRILDLHYDKEAKAYTAGYTDKRVADETKLSLTAVAKIREKLFGPLVDTELKALREEFWQLCSDFDARLKKLEERRA